MSLSNGIVNWVEIAIYRVPAIIIALTVHELAHGWVAWLRGDSTAKDAGRLSLNPLKHLDMMGTILLLFGPFGWAKPVPVSVMNLDNARRDLWKVAIAGPASNIVLAVIFGLLLRFNVAGDVLGGYLGNLLMMCFYINIGLAFFNMLPVPPLDGSNFVLGLLPNNKVAPWLNAMRHAPTILFGLIILEWLTPIKLFSAIIDPLWTPYSRFLSLVIIGHGGLSQ